MFTSDSEKITKQLQNLRNWLNNNNYPKAFHDANLQEPADDPKKKVIPLVTRYCDNFTCNGAIKKANMLLQNCPEINTNGCFENKKVILAHTPNILRELTSAKSDSIDKPVKPKGIYKWDDKKYVIQSSQ